jgi:hypothetical protein
VPIQCVAGGDPDAECTDHDAGDRRGGGAQTSAAIVAGVVGQPALQQMTHPLPAQRIDGLHDKPVQGPEAFFGEAQDAAAAQPADQREKCQQNERREAVKPVGQPLRHRTEPDCRQQGRDAEQQAGECHQQQPRADQLRQADFRQQRAGQGQQRAALRAGCIVLGIARAGVEDRRGVRFDGMIPRKPAATCQTAAFRPSKAVNGSAG